MAWTDLRLTVGGGLAVAVLSMGLAGSAAAAANPRRPPFVEGSSYGSSSPLQSRQPLSLVVNHAPSAPNQSQAPTSAHLAH